MINELRNAWQQKVMARDLFKCRNCGTEKKAKPFIIDKKDRLNSYNPNNGVTLCMNCRKELYNSIEGFKISCLIVMQKSIQ